MRRFIGGSPTAVLLRLVIISLLVGAFMSAFDITPAGLVTRLSLMIQNLFNLSFGTLQKAFIWLSYGAIIVLPVWFVLRVFKYFKK